MTAGIARRVLLHRSVVLRTMLYGAIGAAVVGLDEAGARVHLPAGVHESAAAVIALMLAVRTNTGFSRFWEGRTLWGAIVNTCRNLVDISSCYVKDMTAEELRRFAAWVVTFAWVTRRRLRGQAAWPEVERLLTEGDYSLLQASEHPSLRASRMLSTSVAGWLAEGRIDPQIAQRAQTLVGALVDSLGGCERIAKTPSPFGHVLLMERFIALYLATLPFMLVTRIELLTPLVTMLIAYPVLLLDSLGASLDDPFGHEPSHLPLTRICLTIERNLLGSAPPPELIYLSDTTSKVSHVR